MKTRTRHVLQLLRAYESRNVTFLDPDGTWPIVWQRARGTHVRDADGRRYLDLTAAFGVAAAGHANPRVVRAGQRQMATLLHAMGDVHPHELKARLARELSRISFERWHRIHGASLQTRARTGKTIFCSAGFEAVEAALKTALLATGKRGVIAFEGAYHGLGYGALNATHREHFRARFRSQLGEFARFCPYPFAAAESTNDRHVARRSRGPEGRDLALVETEELLQKMFRRHSIGAVLVEPIQARGGIHVPPAEFLPLLRRLCDEHSALLILDEIYTGFGRTGAWFACERVKVKPDVICLGKALTGGFPLSACVGRADVMDAAWPPSTGEAIHTSTFLGHPVGCAMALANIEEIHTRKLVARSAALGSFLLKSLQTELASRSVHDIRGAGLMAGVELRDPNGAPATDQAIRVIKEMLRRGYILLPEGESANVISFTPPLTITQRELASAVRALADTLSSP